MKRNENCIGDHWENIRSTNIFIIGVPEGEETGKGAKNIIRARIAKNIPNLGKEADTQVQEAQRVSHRINPKKTDQNTL